MILPPVIDYHFNEFAEYVINTAMLLELHMIWFHP